MTPNVPDIAVHNAKLPDVYVEATRALAKCESIDQCKDWADKAMALASYAKQAGDDELMKRAARIKARAIRRCGELLKQFDGRGGDQSESKGALIFGPTQQQVATSAGMSLHQQRTAVRLANVPAEVFETEVEGPSPSTVTKLADLGRKPRPVIDLGDRDPADFNRAMHFKGMLRDYSRELAAWNIHDLAPRLIDVDRDEIRRLIGQIDVVHDTIITRI